MEALLTTFGIDWRLLLVNALNFGILLGGLWYLAYQPLTQMLEKRRKEVAEGVYAAAAAKERLEEVERSKAQKLAEAAREADELMQKSRAAAAAKERELLAEVEAAAASVMRSAEVQGKEIKEQALRESKEEVAKLIVLGMERALKR